MYRKPLPIGIEDFGDIKQNDFYYIDKTLLVKELLDMKGKVNLITRPRRFGKTLTVIPDCTSIWNGCFAQGYTSNVSLLTVNKPTSAVPI